MASGRNLRTVAAIAVTVVIAAGLYQLRRSTIQRFFHRSEAAPDAAAPRLPAHGGPDLGAAPRIRVLLIDGLDRRAAAELPGLSRLCARGWDLVVDTGFPTVSLPVQTALWTGLTQAQAGVLFVAEILSPPPPGALPSRLPDSVAISELHPYLVHSFGFKTAEPPGDKLSKAEKAAWVPDFMDRARAAIGSDARLAFVHIGRVDVAGHEHGRSSRAYRRAASEAEGMATELVAARDDEDTRWFILSDHGHRAGGGHGGFEEAIRRVRACVFGAGVEPMVGDQPVHLVDLSRTLFSSAGVEPAPGSRGRPAGAVARAEVDLGSAVSVLPPPGRQLLALALVALGLAATIAMCGSRAGCWPLWVAVSALSVVAIHGVPTLSMPPVYPPLGRDLYLAASPGFVVLAWAVARSQTRGRSPIAVLVAQLALPASLALGAWIACGGFIAMLDGPPPLLPHWTAAASTLLVIAYAGALVAALAALARVALSVFGRGSGANDRHGEP